MGKLNMWQRLGVVLSVLWLAGMGIYSFHHTIAGRETGMIADLKTCGDTFGSNYSLCLDEYALGETFAYKAAWKSAAIDGLIPIPIGWAAVLAAIWVCGWVRRGREADK